MRTTMAYTAARLVLFLVALLLLDLAGARGVLLIALALLISGILSYVLLSRQRDAMAGALTHRLRGVRGRANDFRTRLDEGTRAEDTDNVAPGAGPATAEDPASPAKNR